MTREEALEILGRMAQNNFYGNHVQEALQMGIDALTKLTSRLRNKESYVSRAEREKGCEDIILEEKTRCLREIQIVKEKYESLPKIRGWVARDKDGTLAFHTGAAPVRMKEFSSRKEIWDNFGSGMNISKSMFPEILWESDPVEVELLIRKIE